MNRGLLFTIGAVIGVYIGWYHWKCPENQPPVQQCAVPKHSCDAAIKGCEVTAATVERELQQCSFVLDTTIEVMVGCVIQTPQACSEEVK
jgi:disulfide bond formation protein DsbB